MKIPARNLILICAFLFALSACSHAPAKMDVMPESSQLQENSDYGSSLVWIKPDADFKKFNKIYIAPVAIYAGEDAKFRDISPEDKANMAAFMRQEFTRVLKEKFTVVDEPGPGVLEIKLTLAGLQKTRPVGTAATHLIPVGLAINLGKSAAGAKGSFMGSVTFATEFIDTENNATLAAALTKRYPNAMDVTTMFDWFTAAKSAVTDGAMAMQAAMVRSAAGGKTQTAPAEQQPAAPAQQATDSAQQPAAPAK